MEKIQKSTFEYFTTNDKAVNTNFYWKCYCIKAKYIKLNCEVQNPDPFEFYYGERLNGVQIVSFDISSFKASPMPIYMITYMLKHRDCFKIWN